MKHWKTLMAALLAALLVACGTAAAPGDPKDPGDGPGNGPGDDPANPAETGHFFLFSGDEVRNTTNPTLEVDADGGVHVVFPAHAVEDAFYAYCDGDCSSLDSMSVVELQTEGTVDNAMLALDADGRPHVLLSTYLRVYYATCEGDCREEAAWNVTPVLEHGGDYEVTGEAFALDPRGRPRFLMHDYRSLAPIGGPDPAAYLVACDADCHRADGWEKHLLHEESWEQSTLRYSADGRAHVVTAVAGESTGHMLAYLVCDADCYDGDNWVGIGFTEAYSDPYVSLMHPAIALALTSDGAPRVGLIGEDEMADGAPTLAYLECDANCTGDNWRASVLIGGEAGEDLGAGIDIALDVAGRPRLSYVASSSILLAYCDGLCADSERFDWDLTAVELASDIPPDEVIPYHNCTVAAWFLREPSLAIGVDGLPRLAYRAEDISAPGGPPDPMHPPCDAGADMTLTRFAQLAGY